MKYECPAAIFTIPPSAIRTAASPPARRGKMSPKIGFAPSAASARICSHRLNKTEKSNRRGKSLSCFAVIIFTPRW